jgi:hypothetical protein
MLQHLKQTDLQAVLAACDSAADKAPMDREASRQRLYDLVDALSGEAQAELLAVMWTGGPRNHASFDENLELAQKTRDENHASHIAEQHARLREYLENGLRAAGVRGS